MEEEPRSWEREERIVGNSAMLATNHFLEQLSRFVPCSWCASKKSEWVPTRVVPGAESVTATTSDL
jgi:hypothetical protein